MPFAYILRCADGTLYVGQTGARLDDCPLRIGLEPNDVSIA
jgi:predicted GIY-YIG superfamily endonuclease